MKTKLTILFLFLCQNLFAQEDKNQIIKLNLSGIALKTYGINYEKILGNRFSINLGLNHRPKQIVPFVSTFSKLTQFADDRVDYISLEKVKKGETEVGLWSITPEIRLYLGKKAAPIGTYIGVFGKLNHYPSKIVAEMELEYKSLNVVLSMPMDTKITTYSGGVVLGKQFSIGKRFTLDWYILGGHYGKVNTQGNAEIDLVGYDDDFRNRLKNKIIDTFKINPDFLKVDVGTEGVSVQNIQRLPYLNLRGFGFNLGYRF